MRTFDTGATRDSDQGKLDYEGFLSPLVLRRYAEYMHKHRKQADGSLRDSDNWQTGMPREAYRKSLVRHFFEAWQQWRDPSPYHAGNPRIQEILCAILFNVMGLLHELLIGRDVGVKDRIVAKLDELAAAVEEDERAEVIACPFCDSWVYEGDGTDHYPAVACDHDPVQPEHVCADRGHRWRSHGLPCSRCGVHRNEETDPLKCSSCGSDEPARYQWPCNGPVADLWHLKRR
jgi:hypothetical protein